MYHGLTDDQDLCVPFLPALFLHSLLSAFFSESEYLLAILYVRPPAHPVAPRLFHGFL